MRQARSRLSETLFLPCFVPSIFYPPSPMTTHSIPKLDKKGLRDFGLTTGAIFAGLFGLILPLLHGHGVPIWPWAIAGILGVWALLAPNTLNPVYYGWMRLGLILGAINSRIILGIVFYALILPTGFLMRIFSKDPMARSLDPQEKTYRILSKTRPKASMEKPF